MQFPFSMTLFLAFVAPLAAAPWQQSTSLPPQLRGIGLDQRLDQQVPLDIPFRNEKGEDVRLQDYFHDKPVILSLVYFECPMLCTRVLDGLVQSMKVVGLEPGKDFEVVTVSFNPLDLPELATAKKANYVRALGKPGAAAAWHFLTGGQPSIDRLTKAVGFRYRYDPKTKQYAHPSGIMVLTPKGKLARYFYGVEYPARDLRLGLVEASAEKIGTPVDEVLLCCYRYDPATGKYGLVIWNLIRIASFSVLLLLGVFLVVMLRRDHRLSSEMPARHIPPREIGRA